MQTQHCPICRLEVAVQPRYPRYVCAECAAKAMSQDGRRLAFFNTDVGGGYAAIYADTKQPYSGHECFIDGIRCHADEARFGGIVIELAAH
ncbi:hypothetical protein EKH80_05110 [Dyella choica]|uniref:ADP-ribosylglycohydrolase n=1 Tax=Dyella choica TaxID=1927959 RepID=A0A432M8K5_9GAMM|nr:hypothetical protein EKH80_05110 [Dyella choica]